MQNVVFYHLLQKDHTFLKESRQRTSLALVLSYLLTSAKIPFSTYSRKLVIYSSLEDNISLFSIICFVFVLYSVFNEHIRLNYLIQYITYSNTFNRCRSLPTGGDDGNRTHYLLNAIQALSQVSYAPIEIFSQR